MSRIDCRHLCHEIYEDYFKFDRCMIRVDDTNIKLNDYGFKFCPICRFHTSLENKAICKCCKSKMRVKRNIYQNNLRNKRERMGLEDYVFLTLEQKYYYMSILI